MMRAQHVVRWPPRFQPRIVCGLRRGTQGTLQRSAAPGITRFAAGGRYLTHLEPLSESALEAGGNCALAIERGAASRRCGHEKNKCAYLVEPLIFGRDTPMIGGYF